MSNVRLNHIAIIMDGNGRFAKKNNIPLLIGHKSGANNAFLIISHVSKLLIPNLTLFALSTENLHRPKKELDGLFSIFNSEFTKSKDKLEKLNVKLNVIGNFNLLSPKIVSSLHRLTEALDNNTGLQLNIALAYGARDEIIEAVRKILQSDNLVNSPANITENEFSKFLYTKDCPDPDLVIRTGGEQRLSNFLLWQSAYSELFFTDTLWPEFDTDELDHIILDYKSRERKFGNSIYSS